MTDDEIKRLEAIRDNESISIDERYKAATEILKLIDAELQRARRLAMVLLIRSERKGVK